MEAGKHFPKMWIWSDEKKDKIIELLGAKEKINLEIIETLKADHKEEIDNIKKRPFRRNQRYQRS